MSKEKRNLKDFLNDIKSNLIGGNKANSDKDVEIVEELMRVRTPVVCNNVPEKVALYSMEGVSILPGETRILVENGVKKNILVIDLLKEMAAECIILLNGHVTGLIL